MGKLRLRRRRVGITGIGNSGKSVFLTSLLSHLKFHDPERLRLGRDGRACVRRFRLLPQQDGRAAFEFENYRRTLVHHGMWPAKTRDAAHVACAFDRSDWRHTSLELDVFDFPGERMADAIMLERGYGGWSDAVLGPVLYDTGNRALAGEFVTALERDGVSADELTAAYKVALARFALAYRPLISPSVFLLGVDGAMARPGSPEAIAAERGAGLPGADLAPLTSTLRARRPELAELFAERYRAYKDQVVQPIFTFLRGCHRLVVLVDVPGILMGGTGRYNDQRLLLEHLVDVLDPHRGLLGRIGAVAAKTVLGERFKPGGITRVALVASKTDMVHPEDRGHLLALLRDMDRHAAADREAWRAEYFPCSAVVSTRAVPGAERTLAGRLVFDEDGAVLAPRGPERKYQVSAVPSEWPVEWEPNRFVFPEVYPQVPPREDLPPKQVGLGRILEFVLQEHPLE